MKIDDKKEFFLSELIGRMKRGEAVFTLAYYAPEDIFHQELLHRKVRGTLVNYERELGKPYRHRPGCQFVAYWDVEMEEWRTFRIIHLVTEGEV
ncbi:MAG: SH3 beta-barrel fold-containing protein [Bacteroides sp.]|nr:SH3 beta-barrel fold-containing protein [Bacteroides sp.]